MIRSIADLLNAFLQEESNKLASFKVRHGPTIGDMYEGLSADILNKVIPTNLNLRVVSGFTVDGQGNLSGQIDCMLVRGCGEQIPFTDSYKWPIKDVLAVFEVKKTLSYRDLKDAFVHLRGVYESSAASIDESKPLNIKRALNVFGQTTGVFSNGKTDDMPSHLQLLHYTLIMEQLTPVIIVWAHGGYKTQTGIREAIIRFMEQSLQDNGIARGFGVGSFPQLISCNGVSLLKANGQPYRTQIRGEVWPFLLSSTTNPVWLMMELIWTKIENTFEVSMPFGDGVEQEAFIEFMAAKTVEKDGSRAWGYEIKDYVGLDDNPKQIVDFKPIEVNKDQSPVLTRIADLGLIDTTDTKFIEYVQSNGYEVGSFIQGLLATGLVSFDGTHLHPTTESIHLVMCPDGKILAGSNHEQMIAYIVGEQRSRG